MVKRTGDPFTKDDFERQEMDQDDNEGAPGTFSMASQDVLQRRVIKKPKSRLGGSTPSSSGIQLGGSSASSPFSFAIPPSTNASAPSAFPTSTSAFPTSTSAFASTNSNPFSMVNNAPSTASQPDQDKERILAFAKDLVGLNVSFEKHVSATIEQDCFADVSWLFSQYEKKRADMIEKYKDIQSLMPAPKRPPVSPAMSNKTVDTAPAATAFSFTSSMPGTTTTPGFSFSAPFKAPTDASSTTSPFSAPLPKSNLAFSFNAPAAPTPSVEPSQEQAQDEEEEQNDEQLDSSALMVGQGEENETVIYTCDRCKLFEQEPDTKEWKSVGVGELKVKKHAESGKGRILMRADMTGRILLNSSILAQMPVKLEKDKEALFFAAPQGTVVRYLLRTKTGSFKDFSAAVESFKK